MLLIALSGGYPKERLEIAGRLVSSGKGPLAAYAQATPSADYPARRVEILRAFLDGPSDAPAERSAVEGMVVAHCLTELEAAEVRQRGGFVWHLYSRPSSVVSIRQGDLMVTDGQKGFAHVYEPMEALSEALLAYLARSGSVRVLLEDLSDGPAR